MSVRAGIVITGHEVLAGRVIDRNGPWLVGKLDSLGAVVTQEVVVGDRAEDIETALRFLTNGGVRLIVTSGGLGPTADDLTAEVVARFAGRRLVYDEGVERRIEAMIAPYAKQWRLDLEAMRAANRKQAMVPEGARVLGPAGTAPGFVVEAGEVTVVVLPGPPGELRRLWQEAVDAPELKATLAGATRWRQRTLRLFGIPESELAASLADLYPRIDPQSLEVTTCASGGEVEVVLRTQQAGEALAEEIVAKIASAQGRNLYSTDGKTVDEIVAEGLAGRSLATAESCSGGMLAARITNRAGASEFFKGGVVAYADEAKVNLLGVDGSLIERHGAVSEEVAEAMASGACERIGAEIGVAITGIAGPSGGTDEKPVGTVCIAVAQVAGAVETRVLRLPGNREDVRQRATTLAMHMLRLVLGGEALPA